METKRPIRVAVVGSGMAGLVTAYLLRHDARQRYSVKVFESGNVFSLDSASISIPNSSRLSDDRIDLPMRAFAGGYYTNLKAMYDHLGIKYHNQNFVFEFAKAQSDPGHQTRSADRSYFIHASNVHKFPPLRPSAMTAISYIMEAMYLLACYSWFSICCFFVAPKTFTQGNSGVLSETVHQYLTRIRLPSYFVTYYLLPLISSVTTCPHQSLLAFPASDLVGYKRRTHRAPHYTVSNGVKTVQERLVDGIQYEISAVVTAVEPEGHRVKLSWRSSKGKDDSNQTEVFDKVVLAVAPDIVGKIFEPLRLHMSRIPTMLVESTVHTDRSALPLDLTREDDKAQWIYLRTSADGVRTESLHVQPCGAIVTTCPFSPIDSSRTIQSAKFTRVLRSPESRRIVNNIFGNTPEFGNHEKELPVWRNGDDNVWLVGGWCWDGMVLLEGCVVSAMRVASALDVDIPWI